MTDHRSENRRLWDEWSDDFQALWEADTIEGELPPAPSPFDEDAPGGPQPAVLDTVEGRSYVELGCGGGQGSVGTAALGADPVVGVDFSGEQLAHARRLRDAYGVTARFVRGDVTRLPFAADSFEVASSEAVFQMVEDLAGALREARRVLVTGGVLVLSVPHQLGAVLGDDEHLERSYFDTGRRRITIDEEYESEMVVFDRTVGELHGALQGAGFDVRRVIEHRHPAVESGQWERGGERPERLWRVPHGVRFWAVAE